MSADDMTASGFPVSRSARRAVAPHRDPLVPYSERHVMWLDRQETYLQWVGLFSALVIALAFLGASVWLISGGHESQGLFLVRLMR